MVLTWMAGWVAMVISGFAQEASDLPSKARKHFPRLLNNSIAYAASSAYQAGKMNHAAKLAKQALNVVGLPENEHKALTYLYALALARSGRTKSAIKTFRLCLDGHGPEPIMHHANWYYGKLLIESWRNGSKEQLEEARRSLSRVPPLSRFGLHARILLVNNLLASGQLDEAVRLAEMAVDLYSGTEREASALLLLARCQYRLGSRIARTNGKKQAYVILQKAANLSQEVAIVWSYLRSGASAKAYLSQLKSQGIWPEPADSRKWIQRAVEIVTQRQRRGDLFILRKIQSLFPKSASDSTRHMLEVLYAELAARYRMFEVAERSVRRVLIRCKDKHICARAGFLLAGLVARTKIRGAIQAYLLVDKRWPDSTYGPFALYKGGEIARRYGNAEDAKSVFQACVNTYPDSPSAAYCRWGLGWMAFQSKQYEQALKWFDAVLETNLDQNEGSILDLIDYFPAKDESLAEDSQVDDGWEKSRQFKDDEPVVLELPYRFSRQLERRRFRERVHYWRARTFHKMGCFGKALSVYRQLMVQHPYDYYSLMAWENLAALGATVDFDNGPSPACISLPMIPDLGETSVNNPEVLAADIYLRMGLEREAETTLKAVDADFLGPTDKRIASLIWLALGDYERSHRVASVPWEGGLPRFLQSDKPTDACLAYPRAFGDVVEGPFRDPNVAADLVFALIRAESGFNQHAQSVAQALGLTQVIRQTAYRTARKLKLRQFQFWKLVRPDVAVQVGSAYLSGLMKIFEGNLVLALAAYNAGEEAVQRWLSRMSELRLDEFIEEIPYNETNRYVKKLLSFYAIYKVLYQSVSSQPLGVKLASVSGSSAYYAKKTAWITNQDH